MVNVMGQQAEIVRAALVKMADVKAAFTTHDPDTTGTILAGAGAATLNTARVALQAEIDKAVWTSTIAAIAPSHRNKALD